MRLESIEVDNFRSWEHGALDMTAITAVSVSGENGAGKSTMFVDAPLWALFGDKHMRSDEVVGHGPDAIAGVSLVVRDNSGQRYNIYRARKFGGPSTLHIQRETEHGTWEALHNGVNESEAFIKDVLLGGRGYDEFVASVYMVQGQHSTFTKAKPAEAKALMTSFLALDRWAGRASWVAEKRLAGEKRLATKQGALNALGDVTEPSQADVMFHQAELDSALAVLNRRKDEQAAAAAEVLAAKDAKAAMDEFIADAEEKKARLARLRHEKAGKEELVARFGSYDLPDMEAKHTGLTSLRDAYKDYESKAAPARMELGSARALEKEQQAVAERETAALEKAMNDEAAICGECGQPIKGDSRLKVQQRIKERISAAESMLRDCAKRAEKAQAILDGLGERPSFDEAAYTALERRIRAARETEMLVSDLRGMDSTEHELSAAYEEAHKRAEAASQVDYREVLARAGVIDSDVRVAEQAWREATAVVARDKAQAEQYERNAVRLTEAQADVEQETAAIKELLLAERAFGRNGIPSYLMEASVPGIESTANELLALLGTDMRLILRTEKQTKSAGAKDTLDVLIFDGEEERAFATYSGGEGFRINFALRVALAELVAKRSGLDLSMLVIDEPEGLDAGGRDMFVQALNVVRERFSTIVLISHHEDLSDALSQKAVVSKGERGSTATFYA